MDNKKIISAVDGVNTAHSLAVMLARATEGDKHTNVLATQIALILGVSANELDGALSPAASKAA